MPELSSIATALRIRRYEMAFGPVLELRIDRTLHQMVMRMGYDSLAVMIPFACGLGLLSVLG